MHFRGGWAGLAQALQKPLRLGHSHASMAAALALHGFAGAATERPLEGVAPERVRGRLQPRLGGLHTKRPLV